MTCSRTFCCDIVRDMADPDGRQILSYDDYSRIFIDLLKEFGAPTHLLDVVAMDEWIINDIGYQAPEARSSARYKNKLFKVFCKLDCEPEGDHEWQFKAADFFRTYA